MTKTPELTDEQIGRIAEFMAAYEDEAIFGDELMEAVGEHIPALIAYARQRNELLDVARMVDAWGHGLRHETAHESKMVKAARAIFAKEDAS